MSTYAFFKPKDLFYFYSARKTFCPKFSARMLMVSIQPDPLSSNNGHFKSIYTQRGKHFAKRKKIINFAMKRAAHMARNLRWEVWMKPLKLDACPFAFHYHPNRISVATNLIHFGIKMTRYLMFTNVQIYLASLKRCETEQNQDTL